MRSRDFKDANFCGEEKSFSKKGFRKYIDINMSTVLVVCASSSLSSSSSSPSSSVGGEEKNSVLSQVRALWDHACFPLFFSLHCK